MKNIPANRYRAVETVLCDDQHKQAGTGMEFPKMDCITGKCKNCGECVLRQCIEAANEQMISVNKWISWRKWMTQKGKSAPDKCQVTGSI